MTVTQPARVVQIPAATLSRYMGTYDIEGEGQKHVVGVTLENGTLFFDYDGKGKEPLIALSPERFSWSGSIVEFSIAADGTASMRIQYVELEEIGPRRK
jgi:hypothetical protein